jgi:hypothetical protein
MDVKPLTAEPTRRDDAARFEHGPGRLHRYASLFLRSIRQNLLRAPRNKEAVRGPDRALSRTCGSIGRKNRFAPSRVKLVARARLQSRGSARCFGGSEACFDEVSDKCAGSVKPAPKAAAIDLSATAEKACHAYL